MENQDYHSYTHSPTRSSYHGLPSSTDSDLKNKESTHQDREDSDVTNGTDIFARGLFESNRDPLRDNFDNKEEKSTASITITESSTSSQINEPHKKLIESHKFTFWQKAEWVGKKVGWGLVALVVSVIAIATFPISGTIAYFYFKQDAIKEKKAEFSNESVKIIQNEMKNLKDVMKTSSTNWGNVQPKETREISNKEQRVLDTVWSYAKAYKECRGANEALVKPIEENILSPKIAKLLDKLEKKLLDRSSCDKILKEIKELFLECVISSIVEASHHRERYKEQFSSECHFARGNLFPKTLENNFELETADGQKKKFKETVKQLNNDCSRSYLEQRDAKLFKSQIDYMKSNKGIRLSPLKGETQVQGTLLNGLEDRLAIEGAGKEGADKPIDTILRGSYAVHGMKDVFKAKEGTLQKRSVGIYELDRHLQVLESLDRDSSEYKNELKRFGFKNIEDLRSELHHRRDLSIAQALPKIVRSVEIISKDPEALRMAVATGKFLYVEEGLLTHSGIKDDKEKSMIEDMKGTMDYLRNNTEIRFDDSMKIGDSPKITVGYPQSASKSDELDLSNPKVTIVIPNPSKVIHEDRPFELESLYFNTGMNEQAAIAPYTGVYDPLEDDINKEGNDILVKYAHSSTDALTSEINQLAAKIKKANDKITWINTHTSEVKRRELVAGSYDFNVDEGDHDKQVSTRLEREKEARAQIAELETSIKQFEAEKQKLTKDKETLESFPKAIAGSTGIQAINLRNQVVSILKGVKGRCCKSSKDRTGVEVPRTLAAAAVKLDPTINEKELRTQLQKSGRMIAGYNIGNVDRPGFKFSNLQLNLLDKAHRPPKEFCNDRTQD